MDEIDETFFVNLTNSVGGVIADPQGLGTILDNDTPPNLLINGRTLARGRQRHHQNFVFDLTLTVPSGRPIPVSFTTVNGTGPNAATVANNDYIPTSGTLTFAPGAVTQKITVQVVGDTSVEGDENFEVRLTVNPVVPPLVGNLNPPAFLSATGLIKDDDTKVRIANPAINTLEGTMPPDATDNHNEVFLVVLPAASTQTVLVPYTTVDGVGVTGAKASNNDYVATSGTLTFAPGSITERITVNIKADSTSEADEAFTVELGTPTNAILDPAGASVGTVTILNDDGPPLLAIGDPAAAKKESTAGVTNQLVFPVTLTAPSGLPIVVSYDTVSGTPGPVDGTPDGAVAGSDFVGVTGGLITFSPGEISKDITISLINDGVVEDSETFDVVLTGPAGSLGMDVTGTGTILDDEPTVSITQSSVSPVPEGDAPGGVPALTNVTFAIVLSDIPFGTVVVNYFTAPGSTNPATPNVDYTHVPPTPVTFDGSLSEISKTVTVQVIGDNVPELDETFQVDITTDPNFARLGTRPAVVTIDDDEPLISFVPTAKTQNEGTPPTVTTSPMTFDVTLNRVPLENVTVVVSDTPGTATTPADYTFTDQTLTFLANTTVLSQTVTATIIADALNEGDHGFTLHLTAAFNATIVAATATATIDDDDATPSAFIQAVAGSTVNEGDSGLTPAVFAVRLDNPSGLQVTVGYRTLNNTAAAPDDFNAVTNGTVTFAPGETSKNITIDVKGDTTLETNETFHVDLIAAGTTNTNLLTGQTRADGAILDDEARASIVPPSGPFAEGSNVVIDVVLDRITPVQRLVIVNTADGSAVAGQDYNGITNATLTFAAGDANTTRKITVTTVGDVIDEFNESFQVNISGEPNLVVPSASSATATIADDDPPPVVSIGDTTTPETDSSVSNALFNVTLSAASAKTITVEFATSNGTAAAGADYNSTVGTLTFLPGQTAKTITVQVLGDLQGEPDQTFFVNLSSPDLTVATIGDGQGAGTIIDNEPRVFFSGANGGDQTVVESNGVSVNASFTVALTKPSDSPVQVTVNFATADGTAIGGQDYTTVSSSVVFNPGETVKTITVPVSGDLLDEDEETFFVNLTGATNAFINDPQAQGTILDNDATPSLTIADVSVAEDDSILDAVFVVTLSAPSGRTVTVAYATANQSAAAGSDYVAQINSLVFTPGQTEQRITVTVNADNVGEPNETFLVNLSSPFNASLADGQAVGTILDDEPRLLILDASVTETDSGLSSVTVEVQLDRIYSEIVSVLYSTANGTAVAVNDYVSASGTLFFGVGTTSQLITLSIQGDTLDEIDEAFFVNLTSPSTNSVILDGQAQVTIFDNDGPPTVSIFDRTVSEGNGGTVNAVFSVQLNTASGLEVRVPFSTANGSATVAGNDYNPNSGVLTIAPGLTEGFITVQVKGDTLGEANENFFVNLSTPINGTLGDGQGEGMILDDEPRISIGDRTVMETNSTVNAVFTVSLSSAPSGDVTVAFNTAAVTATAGSDYTSVSGTLTFTGGQTTTTITVPMAGDLLDEVDETFLVNLSANSSNSVMLDGQAVGTIQDNDPPPTISIGDVIVTEGNSGTVNAVFPVTLSAASGLTVTVQFNTADGTVSPANAGADYVPISGGLVTFNAGETQQNITVQVIGERVAENDETFLVNLINPSNAGIADGQGVGTILDDEPLVTIDPASVTEGNADVSMVFIVRMDRASSQNVVVSYFTLDGSATSGADYGAVTSGSITFTPGQVQVPLTVTVHGDLLNEPSETFTVNLSAVASGNAKITVPTALGTILNDDPLPGLAIGSPLPVTETNSFTTPAVFPVTLLAASGQTVTVVFTTADGTAIAGADYDSTTGTLTFNPGETQKSITVQVRGDTLGEPNETFLVQLQSPVNATITVGQGTGTIADDEPRISINDITVTEGEANTTATFTVSLAGTASGTVTVGFITAAGTATAGTDYLTTSGSVTFLVGETSKPITVTIVGDSLDESNETFNVNLTSVSSNAVVADSQGIGTINDNDATPSLSIGDASVIEGDAGQVNMLFTVLLSAASGNGVTVNYGTTAGSATAGLDFQLTSGSLSFAAGTTQQTITVRVNGDFAGELDETFTVNLSGAANATVSDGSAIGTITNDDGVLRISDVSVNETEAGVARSSPSRSRRQSRRSKSPLPMPRRQARLPRAPIIRAPAAH